MFWPDVLDASARGSLRSALWSVRQSLGPATDDYLQLERDRIGFLAEADLRLDTDDLDDLVAAGRLVEAADAGAVELLPGVTDDWVLEARDAHRRRMVVMLETLAQQAGADGRTGTAVDWTRRQLAVDPHADEPVRRLMIRLPRPGTGSPRSVPTSATVSCWLVSWTRVRRKS